jgi:hypothetical protein
VNTVFGASQVPEGIPFIEHDIGFLLWLADALSIPLGSLSIPLVLIGFRL